MSLPLSNRRRPERICAIVINYFGNAKTRRCLESLAREAITTIYVADNSTDNNEQISLQKVITEVAATYSATRIELVINATNLGFGRTINELIRRNLRLTMPADHYLIINNDAELHPGATMHLVQALNNDSSLALAAPCVRTACGTTGFFHYWRYSGAVSLRRHRLAFPYLTGCCLMVPRWFAVNEPLFDRAFFMTRHLADVPLLLAGRAGLLLARACLRALRYRTLAPILAYALCWFDIDVSSPRPPRELRRPEAGPHQP